MMGKRLGWLLALGLAVSVAGVASAQDNTNRGGDGQRQGDDRGRGGDRGNFDPAQFRQRMEERMKEQLGVNDEEWKVIQPRIEKVMAAQRDARSGGMAFGFGGFSGRDGGRGPRGGDQASSPVAKAQSDLRSALEDKSISADQIKERLETLRKAREQARQDLVKAQAELKEVLTQRQEAQLVLMGTLE